MPPSTAAALPTRCPKCANDMTQVATTPHRLMPQMRRTTFVCYTCNQTCSYMLPLAAAAED